MNFYGDDENDVDAKKPKEKGKLENQLLRIEEEGRDEADDESGEIQRGVREPKNTIILGARTGRRNHEEKERGG